MEDLPTRWRVGSARFAAKIAAVVLIAGLGAACGGPAPSQPDVAAPVDAGADLSEAPDVVAAEDLTTSEDIRHLESCDAFGPGCGALPAPLATPPCGAILWGDEAPFPERLSALDCLAPGDPYTPGPGVIPYGVAAPLFSEGSAKARFLSGPAPSPLTPTVYGPWQVVDGTVLVKTFGFPKRAGEAPVAVEVRVMAKRDDAWIFGTYAWDAALGDGVLVSQDGGRVDVTIEDRGQPKTLSWWLPGIRGCKSCHGTGDTDAIGLTTAQLAFTVDYADVRADQLIAFESAGWLANVPAREAIGSALPHLGEGGLEGSARAWLHGNCAHCHRPGGFAPADFALDLRAELPLSQAGLCDAPPKTSGLPRGLVLLAPGSPEESYLLQRILTPDAERMPPDGGSLVDTRGVAALRAWITALQTCPE